MTRFGRRSGVFCHPTSLPGPNGIGTFGDSARDFLDRLEAADQSCWQLCPLGPVSGDHGNSPYVAYSAFALSPLLIDLETLVDEGLLPARAIADARTPAALPTGWVDYDAVRAFKTPLLRDAFETMLETDTHRRAFDAFRERHDWLEPYALFRALRAQFDGDAWTEWPEPIRDREPDALERWRTKLETEIEYHEFTQWLAVSQWRTLKTYATECEIDIVGDLPIYVGHDSADVWANQSYFEIDEHGKPALVAGVPADPEGNPPQKWGPPVYDWDAIAADGYEWWIDRFSWLFELTDIVRIDHFLGFDHYWAIPADEPATVGEWHDGPGWELFAAVRAETGTLPVIAEDIGFTTPETDRLRRRLEAPGLKVLQYADWCVADDPDLPHTGDSDCVVYPSTHDTNTVRGWYEALSDRQRACVHRYLDLADADGTEDASDAIHWALITAAWESDAGVAISTVQDLLGLGAEARFNTPGTAEGNWGWRVSREELEALPVDRLQSLTAATGRDR